MTVHVGALVECSMADGAHPRTQAGMDKLMRLQVMFLRREKNENRSSYDQTSRRYGVLYTIEWQTPERQEFEAKTTGVRIE